MRRMARRGSGRGGRVIQRRRGGRVVKRGGRRGVVAKEGCGGVGLLRAAEKAVEDVLVVVCASKVGDGSLVFLMHCSRRGRRGGSVRAVG